MIVEIDSGSGFCFGVVYAIEKAEEELSISDHLYCLGDIVHNSVEVERLVKKGLKTINHETLNDITNSKVLIRAHGEPPETYSTALENGIELIDSTCPVVLKLQNKIRNGYEEYVKINGQIVIYGKKGHAEVNGLVGQTNNSAIVIEGPEDLDKIDFSKPVNLFSQTTKSIEGFKDLSRKILDKIKEKHPEMEKHFIINDTICRQVSTRGPKLKKFARKHNIIIFVSGKKSSNGQMLYNVCKGENKNTYFVSDENDLKDEWFEGTSSVGICGATSTPRWLMEKIADKIKHVY
jgi:4-hydroxy-3-methylbut-2-enyl diphosphate reductase